MDKSRNLTLNAGEALYQPELDQAKSDHAAAYAEMIRDGIGAARDLSRLARMAGVSPKLAAFYLGRAQGYLAVVQDAHGALAALVSE